MYGFMGRVTDQDLKKLTDGITVNGERLHAKSATLDRVQGGNTWLTIVLTEGKNREIRRMVEALGRTCEPLDPHCLWPL